MVSMDGDLAVVGLGAIGSMALWRAAARGLRVVGYEQFGIANDRGASSGQTRRFSALSQRDPRFTPLAMDALGLWRELQARSGRILLEQVGGLIIGPGETPALDLAAESGSTFGVAHELLDAAELRRRYPQHLIRDDDRGIFEPGGGFLRPELAVWCAVREAQSRGARVIDHTRVFAVEPDADGVTVHATSGTRRYRGAVVAPGAWAKELLPPARDLVVARRLVQGWYLPSDVAAYRPEVFPVFERVGDARVYGFPSLDGATIKIAAYGQDHPLVHDLDHPPRTVGLELVRSLRDVIHRYFPGLHPDPVTTSTAIEGYTTDGRPLLGPPRAADRLIMACGFSGAGFKFAPVMGELCAELATQQPAHRDITFLSPERDVPSWTAEHLAPS